MKRTLITLVSILLIAFLFSGCNRGTATPIQVSDNQTSSEREKELMKQFEDLEKSQSNSNTVDSNSNTVDSNSTTDTDSQKNTNSSSNSNNEKKSGEVKATAINMNETITVGDTVEFTLTSSEWSEEILPSNTSDYYSYIKDVEGEKYFIVRGTAKNLTGSEIDLSYKSDGELLINNKYSSKISVSEEDTEKNGFYGKLKPLQTLNIVVYASVSDEVYNLWETMDLTLNIFDNSADVDKYFYSIKDKSTYQSYLIKFSK